MSHKLKSHLRAAATLAVLLVVVALLTTLQRSLSPATDSRPASAQGSTLTVHGSAGPEREASEERLRLRELRERRYEQFKQRRGFEPVAGGTLRAAFLPGTRFTRRALLQYLASGATLPTIIRETQRRADDEIVRTEWQKRYPRDRAALIRQSGSTLSQSGRLTLIKIPRLSPWQSRRQARLQRLYGSGSLSQ